MLDGFLLWGESISVLLTPFRQRNVYSWNTWNAYRCGSEVHHLCSFLLLKHTCRN